MLGRFLKGLEEGIEGCRGEHVDLVDDEHLVLTDLRWDAGLLHEGLDMLDGVVGGGIEFKDVERTLFVECLAALAMTTCLALVGRCQTVDGFGKDTGTGGLSYSAGTAEEVGMCQFTALDSILQGGGKGKLAYHCIEGHGAVFSR